MIIIWKYQKQSKIHPGYRKVSKYSSLFDPVYWIGRDHCWIPCDYRFQKKCWYLLRGRIDRYIDKNWNEKSSIIPSWYIRLSPTIYQIDMYRMWRNRIRKFYNINIRPCILRIYYIAKSLGLLWGTQATKKK